MARRRDHFAGMVSDGKSHGPCRAPLLPECRRRYLFFRLEQPKTFEMQHGAILRRNLSAIKQRQGVNRKSANEKGVPFTRPGALLRNRAQQRRSHP